MEHYRYYWYTVWPGMRRFKLSPVCGWPAPTPPSSSRWPCTRSSLSSKGTPPAPCLERSRWCWKCRQSARLGCQAPPLLDRYIFCCCICVVCTSVYTVSVYIKIMQVEGGKILSTVILISLASLFDFSELSEIQKNKIKQRAKARLMTTVASTKP